MSRSAAGPLSLPALLYLAWSALAWGWWALALAPLPPASPEWLLRTRQVCFGPLESGLPDGYGLIMLSAPLWLLGALLCLWGADLVALARRLQRRLPGRLLVILALLLPLAGGAWVGGRLARGLEARAAMQAPPSVEEPLPRTYPRLDRPLPPLRLVDQTGRTVTEAVLEGRISFLTFAFAHCPSVCPSLVSTLRQARAEAAEVDPLLVILTLDPWRDTPSSLASLAQGWGLPRGALVLSGEVAQVNRALDAFGVPRSRNLQNGDIQHPALVYVSDGRGRLAYAFTNPPASWLAEAARRLARGS
ncbi:MAG TPA: SCO family protein [Candidatus Nitrosotenuis sp.]|nr:SCO family protein [Candidatus Nitrosotenuis sp.]